MNSNVIPLFGDSEWLQNGKRVYAYCTGMRRRVRFLLLAERSNKALRKRTVERCIRAIDKRWKKLSTFLQVLRNAENTWSDVSPFESALGNYLNIAGSKWYIDEDTIEEVLSHMLWMDGSSHELELILDMLEVLRLTRKEILEVIRWETASKIIQFSDTDLYRIFRHVHGNSL